jgi:hypothetical protein
VSEHNVQCQTVISGVLVVAVTAKVARANVQLHVSLQQFPGRGNDGVSKVRTGATRSAAPIDDAQRPGLNAGKRLRRKPLPFPKGREVGLRKGRKRNGGNRS